MILMDANFPADPLMLDLFRVELENHTRTLEAGLVEAERDQSPEKIEPLMRAAHSIKGAARIVGLNTAVGLAHAMEDVLSAAQRSARPLSQEAVDCLLKSNDLFVSLSRLEVAALSGALDSRAAEIQGMAGRLREFLESGDASKRETPLLKSLTPSVAVGSERRMTDLALPDKSVPSVLPPQDKVFPATNADPLMLDLFRVELENHTRTLEAGLVEAERDQSPEKIEPLMRAAHSIKGAARIVGLNTAVGLAHAMEDVLSAAQRSARPLSQEAVDCLLKSNDLFVSLSRLEVAALSGALDSRAAEIQGMAGRLREFLESGDASKRETPLLKSLTPSVAVGSERRMADLALPDKSAPSVLPLENKVHPARRASDRLKASPEKAEPGLVRVMAENMNHLMGLAGECLVQAQSVKTFYDNLLAMKKGLFELEKPLKLALETGEDATVDTATIREVLERLFEAQEASSRDIARFERFSRRLEHLAHRLYGEVISSRMVPFSDGLHGFFRMVRDLAKETGKKVRFEIAGSSTPVDRDILEKLEAPLSHLIRNAVDHGIESPEERIAAGKPAEGRLVLEARHMAGMLNIRISDDGRGINPESLRNKVVQKGYVTQDMAKSLSRTELFEFLFLPGFSTAKAVTEISGRGVGLDVVFNMAQEVGGSVRVDADAGSGARFQLQLPLTLSVLRTMLLEIAGESYALPLSRVDRILRLSRKEIQEIEDHQYCTLDGEHVGILDARQLFHLMPPDNPSGVFAIVVISDRMNRYGLCVDRFLGEQNLVVRPLDARLGKVPNISAGAVLDDGSPVIIFDADDLVRSIHQLLTSGKVQKVSGIRELGLEKKKILIVDDSLTVREVERRLLENAGYEVMVAVDGIDGWNTLMANRFDLLVSDVDMPRMNGIELVRKVKEAPLFKEIPVMIVSYKDREEDRLRGLEAGADYYLTKGSFHDESLLVAVRDLIGSP
jgi:two-component system, chemotaxis family, sensor histidine kinase and response regulator WspE